MGKARLYLTMIWHNIYTVKKLGRKQRESRLSAAETAEALWYPGRSKPSFELSPAKNDTKAARVGARKYKGNISNAMYQRKGACALSRPVTTGGPHLTKKRSHVDLWRKLLFQVPHWWQSVSDVDWLYHLSVTDWPLRRNRCEVRGNGALTRAFTLSGGTLTLTIPDLTIVFTGAAN